MNRLAIAAAILTAVSCGPRGTDAERRRDAARADSSAAGYAVAPLREAPAAPVPAPPAAAAPAAQAIAAPGPRAPVRPPDRRTGVTSPRDSTGAPRPGAVARADSARSAALPPPRPTAPSPLPAAPEPPIDTGPVQVDRFLWYDTSRKLARLRLVAAYTGANDGLNFNGGTAGDRTLVVPLGWRVNVTVANDDDALSHSALVARHEVPVPPEPPPPAFAGAAIPSLARGLPSGESEEMSFVASSTGQFMLVCGMPGHGESGMWIGFEVSASAAVPAYR